MEVRNRFKGLADRQCLMNYGWRFMTLYRRQGSRPSPWKRNAKKQNGCLRRPYKSYEKKRSEKQRRKGKIFPFECIDELPLAVTLYPLTIPKKKKCKKA